MIDPTAIIHPNVTLGSNVTVEAHCIIGIAPPGMEDATTVIGDDAVIRAGSYIYAGNHIGRRFQTGNKVNIREANTIGDDVSIGTLSCIEHHVTIEDRVRIHSQAFVPEYSTLREDSWIGPGTVLTNARYPGHPNAKNELKGVELKPKARLGANVTILPGVVVGAGALVGAGSTVTRDVEDGAVVAGSPAVKLYDVHY